MADWQKSGCRSKNELATRKIRQSVGFPQDKGHAGLLSKYDELLMLDVRNKRVTVAGLGRFGGGIAVTRWLVEQGAARVRVTDREPAEKLADSVRQLEGLPVELRLGEHREEDFTSADLVVASPALPPANPYLRAARNAGVAVTTEICLFVERCTNTVLGVTGTKGKSTTATLLHRMLSARHKTWVGGNLGGSLLAALPQMQPNDLVVLELSSYMLWWLGAMRWSPHVGLVTLVTSDHLEWHDNDVRAYVDAKRNLLRFQRPSDYAVLNEEDEVSRAFSHDTPGKVVLFGLRNRKPFALRLPGQHNQLNAQGAYAAAQIFGVSWDEAQAAIRDADPLPHRLQTVHEQAGVRWVNDSIATVPDAAIAALESFPPRRVIQIVGGHDNGTPVTALCNLLAERAKAALCVGPTGRRIAARLADSSLPSGACSVYDCGDLATAVRTARTVATAGDVVLLSPGCKSYDQFVNFEERGDTFTRLAQKSC
jgi:UDP-N-acetylmuramoylalanine--D-glutamate ligase